MLDDLIDAVGGLETLVVVKQEGERRVSERGIQDICAKIGLEHDKWPRGWDPRLVVQNNGSFVTRLKQYVDAFTDINLNNTMLSEVGRIAESNATSATPLFFDLTDNILNWPSGQFRSNGSCLRGSYAYSTMAIKDAGGVVLRLFRPGGGPSKNYHGNFIGEGRVFLLPSKGQIVLTNNYGFGGDGKKYANMIVQALVDRGIEAEWYRAEVKATNMYLNESTTYAIKPKKAKEYTSFSLKPKQNWSHSRCGVCGKTMFYAKGEGDGKSICEDCGNRCYVCSGETTHYELTWLADTKAWICKSCSKQRKLIECECGLVYEKERCECQK